MREQIKCNHVWPWILVLSATLEMSFISLRQLFTCTIQVYPYSIHTLSVAFLLSTVNCQDILHMWGNQAKWVWTCRYHIFSFLVGLILHLKSYILLKTPLKSDIPFQSYDPLKACQNNRKQKHLFPLFGSISRSIFANSDSFCLIIPHIIHTSQTRVKTISLPAS